MKTQLPTMPPPSWTFMRIEDAGPAPPPAPYGARGAVRVLLLSLADVLQLWWRRYVSGDTSVGYSTRKLSRTA